MALIPLAARKQPEAPASVARTQTVPSLPVPPTNQTLLVQPPDNNPNAAGNLFPETRLPPTIRGIDYAFGEYLNTSLTGARFAASTIIEFPIPVDFHKRYLYALVTSLPTVVGNYYVMAEVLLLKDNSQVASLPLIDAVPAAAASVLPRSLVSFFASGGNVIDSSVIFYPQQQQSWEQTQYTLQPQYFEGDFDKLRVNVKDCLNVSSFRVYLSCKSVAKFSSR